jgi:guanyl-specific ribonuclease Sa
MAKQKSLFPIIRALSLPEDVRIAVTQVKNRIGRGLPPRAQTFRNRPAVLPNLDDGCQYYEFQVGAAHPDDQRPAGQRRLVVEVNEKALQVREIYFTDQHYASGSFQRIVS